MNNMRFIGSSFAFLSIVFQIEREEMDETLQKSSFDAIQRRIAMGDVDSVVRLRGLPFACSKEDIVKFFSGNCFYFYH